MKLHNHVFTTSHIIGTTTFLFFFRSEAKRYAGADVKQRKKKGWPKGPSVNIDVFLETILVRLGGRGFEPCASFRASEKYRCKYLKFRRSLHADV